MRKDLLDLANSAIKIAKAAGASASSVNITSERSVEISYRDRKPENIKEASTRDLYIRVYVDGRYASQSTSDLRPDALKTFITDAVAMTRLLAEDPFRSLPDAKYYEGRATVNLGLMDPAYEKLVPEERHKLARAAEEACLEKGGKRVISATSSFQDSFTQDIMLTSNGFEGYTEGTAYVSVVQMTAQDEGDRRPASYDFAVSVDRSTLPPPEAVGVGAADRTLALLGGKKIKTETLPIIVENRVVPRILGGLLGAMFGRAIQQKQSFLADKKGVRIASDALTLIDDPFIFQGLGSRLWDGDGITAKRRTMIDAGVLNEFWVDWYYGRKLGWEPTSGGPSNLIIPPGRRPVAAIMKDLKRGILITDFIGGNNNTTTGDSSVGIIGKLFEDGEPVQTVSEMNIADNALSFWPKLMEVGNDPWPNSRQRTPSLVFKDVVVAGL